jgi:hypothetical protein
VSTCANALLDRGIGLAQILKVATNAGKAEDKVSINQRSKDCLSCTSLRRAGLKTKVIEPGTGLTLQSAIERGACYLHREKIADCHLGFCCYESAAAHALVATSDLIPGSIALTPGCSAECLDVRMCAAACCCSLFRSRRH